MARKIFINYRRGDSAGTAGRLRDRLAHAFGTDNLFMDVDNIPAGIDFVNHLSAQVAICDVFLVVIGSSWLNIKDESGHRRLDDPDDFVRLEIAAALSRNIPVIPVTIDGADLPKANELPDTLAPLVRRQAVQLHNAHFRQDVEALIEKIGNLFTSERAESAIPAGTEPLRKMDRVRWRATLTGVGIILLTGWVGFSQLGMPLFWIPPASGAVVAGEGIVRFDGIWRIDRLGCPPRPQLNFMIHIDNGNVSGRFEPQEMSAIPGVRPPIVGAISASGQINFSHLGVRDNGGIDNTPTYYSGTLHGTTAPGTFSRSNGACNGTFTLTRA
jgi:TIR domain